MKSETLETMKAIVVGASETLEYLGTKSANLNGSERASCLMRMNELNDAYHVLCAWAMPDRTGVETPVLKHRDTEFNVFERQQIAPCIRCNRKNHRAGLDLVCGVCRYEEHRPEKHGINCWKVRHLGNAGHLHDEDDDGPFDVDGVTYCGRCHIALRGRDE